VYLGIPGAGATIRTVVNIQSGGKNKTFRNGCACIVSYSFGLSLLPHKFLLLYCRHFSNRWNWVMDYKGLMHF
jgi:hypothetical protein